MIRAESLGWIRRPVNPWPIPATFGPANGGAIPDETHKEALNDDDGREKVRSSGRGLFDLPDASLLRSSVASSSTNPSADGLRRRAL